MGGSESTRRVTVERDAEEESAGVVRVISCYFFENSCSGEFGTSFKLNLTL